MATAPTTQSPLDPRDPYPSRPGIFRDHNCWKCADELVTRASANTRTPAMTDVASHGGQADDAEEC